MPNQNLNDLYNSQYYSFHEFGFKSENRLDHNLMLKLLAVKKTDRVLEIGCGLGILLKKIASDYKTGTETNDTAIEECREAGLNVIKTASEHELPFENSSSDIIIMNEVIEHLKNPEKMLKECARILVPGGRIIITTPSKNLFVHDLSLTHFSEMSVKELRKILRLNHFKILSHQVSGISFVYPILENVFFKPFRFLRFFLKKRHKDVSAIDTCHKLADKTFLKIFSGYRKYLLGFGVNQIILARKK